MAEKAPLERLGSAIRLRREQLEFSVRDAAARAGISTTTWVSAETGLARPQGVTLAKVDRALRWPAGTCRGVLEGGQVPASTEKAPSGDTAGVVAEWARTTPGIEAHERAFILAVVARTRHRA